MRAGESVAFRESPGQTGRLDRSAFVAKRTKLSHVMQLAGKNGVVFLEVKNTFLFTREGSYAMTSKLLQSW